MKRILIMLPLLILATLLSESCSEHTTERKVYAFLKKTAEDATKACPIQVDSVLKLENIVAFPPATLRYNYTLKFDTTNYDIKAFEKTIRTTTLNTVKTSPDSKIFKDLFTTLEYNYSDTLGNHLFRIVITPLDYIKNSK